MSETFTDDFSSVYFTGNVNSPAVHQVFCGNWRSVVTTYESVFKRLSTLDVASSMGPDGFHPKLLSSCQANAYPIYQIKKKKKKIQYGQLPTQGKKMFSHSSV